MAPVDADASARQSKTRIMMKTRSLSKCKHYLPKNPPTSTPSKRLYSVSFLKHDYLPLYFIIYCFIYCKPRFFVCISTPSTFIWNERDEDQQMQALSNQESHMQTLIIYKLGFNQNYYTFTLMLLIKIVLCIKFPWINFIKYKCFEMKSSKELLKWAQPLHSDIRIYCTTFIFNPKLQNSKLETENRNPRILRRAP